MIALPWERKYTGVLVMVVEEFLGVIRREWDCRLPFDAVNPSLVVARESVFLRMLGDRVAIVVVDGNIAIISARSAPMSRRGTSERD